MTGSRPRPRPDHLEAKAKAGTVRGQGQGHDFGSSSSRTVLEDPIPGNKAYYITLTTCLMFDDDPILLDLGLGMQYIDFSGYEARRIVIPIY